jgi:hypothetical protein
MFLRPTSFVIAAASAVVVIAFGTANPRAEQQPPPIHGVTGTVATENTVREVHDGARAVLSKTARLFRWSRQSEVPTGDAAGDETLAGLRTGTIILVHNPAAGEHLTSGQIERLAGDGLNQVEGVILAVSRTDRTISIRLADGTRQTIQLSQRPVRVGADDVVVFAKDEAGERVAHYFKRIP